MGNYLTKPKLAYCVEKKKIIVQQSLILLKMRTNIEL